MAKIKSQLQQELTLDRLKYLDIEMKGIYSEEISRKLRKHYKLKIEINASKDKLNSLEALLK
jgi:hypothetical protein